MSQNSHEKDCDVTLTSKKRTPSRVFYCKFCISEQPFLEQVVMNVPMVMFNWSDKYRFQPGLEYLLLSLSSLSLRNSEQTCHF